LFRSFGVRVVGGPTGGRAGRLAAGGTAGVAMTPARRERQNGRTIATGDRPRRRRVMPEITPNLWFDTAGKEAAEFYVSVFPNSAITNVSYYGDAGPRPAGTVLTVEFNLDGKPFTTLNGGPEFRFNEAISLLISCADQQEVDYYWTKLSDGGEEGQCGWLKDRYGVSWQVCPVELGEILGDPGPGRANRAMRAMLAMRRIDLDALRAAADQEEAPPA
jgi:predicted 3-demethylubiquinone-9 3-methyltransferase (glyoxalase superfamily)